PADWTGDSWPATMWAICQNYPVAFGVRDDAGDIVEGKFEEGYGNCYIDAAFKGQKGKFRALDEAVMITFALCVVREPGYGEVDKNVIVGSKDATETYEPKEGKKRTVPQIRYLARAYSSIFAPMLAASYLKPAEVCARDFEVTLSDKKYTVAMQQVTEDHMPG